MAPAAVQPRASNEELVVREGKGEERGHHNTQPGGVDDGAAH